MEWAVAGTIIFSLALAGPVGWVQLPRPECRALQQKAFGYVPDLRGRLIPTGERADVTIKCLVKS